MKSKNILIYSIVTILCLSCEYEKIEPVQEITTEVSFKTDVMPVFNASCNSSSCHGAGATPPDLSPENAYLAVTLGGMIDTTAPETSILYKRMIDKSSPMPTSGLLPEYTTKTILAWIKQGAKEN